MIYLLLSIKSIRGESMDMQLMQVFIHGRRVLKQCTYLSFICQHGLSRDWSVRRLLLPYIYTRPLVQLYSAHWVSFVLQGIFKIPWTFLKDLSTLIFFLGFLFPMFNVKLFSGGRSKVSRNVFYCPFRSSC